MNGLDFRATEVRKACCKSKKSCIKLSKYGKNVEC